MRQLVNLSGLRVAVLLLGWLALAGCTAPAASLPPTAAPATAAPPAATVVPPTVTVVPPTVTALPPTATALPPTATALPPTATALPPTATTAPPTAAPTAAPASDQGSYVFPVQGGEVSYGPSHHDYPATDIFCPVGSQFVAPTAGVVDAISAQDVWDPASDDPAVRGGLSVAVVGDDGVRYYGSHLSAIAEGIVPGARVAAGQLLGLTGKSGNARSTPPHLHFGISHPTTPDDWQVRRGEIAPYPYLRAWQRGESLAPALP